MTEKSFLDWRDGAEAEALIALVEDPGSVPSAHMVASITPVPGSLVLSSTLCGQ